MGREGPPPLPPFLRFCLWYALRWEKSSVNITIFASQRVCMGSHVLLKTPINLSNLALKIALKIDSTIFWRKLNPSFQPFVHDYCFVYLNQGMCALRACACEKWRVRVHKVKSTRFQHYSFQEKQKPKWENDNRGTMFVTQKERKRKMNRGTRVKYKQVIRSKSLTVEQASKGTSLYMLLQNMQLLKRNKRTS